MSILGMLVAGAAHVAQQPPHYVFGYSIAEWLSLLSILALFIGSLSWIFRVVLIAPLNYQMKELAHQIKDMGAINQQQSDANERLLQQHTDMLQEHERMLIRHEEDIHTLFKNDYKKDK
ncbi:hypothetical protein [Lactiplantibacillus plantarum]